MGVIEDVRQVLQDFLAPELREIHSQFASVGSQFAAMGSQFVAIDKRLDAMEEMNRIRFESLTQRLEQIQQSFAFDKRISDLEEDRRRSA
jgi:hypothetical protein